MNFDAVIVGGGVIGCAIALELQKSGLESVLIEKNPFLGEEVSSRNSGVIHSGIYYPNNSLKNKLTFQGNQLLYEYALKNNVPFKKTGKIIFGLPDEKDKLLSLYKNGLKNGVKGLTLLEKDQIHELEPNLNSEISNGILSEHTGVIDVPALVESLSIQFENNGGIVTKNSIFKAYKYKHRNHISEIQTGDEVFRIKSKKIIFSCGLNSYKVGSLIPNIYHSKYLRELNFTKGHYFKIFGFKPFNHLIYPMPDSHGLGIHYTVDISGAVKFGPDIEFINNLDYSFSRNVKIKFEDSIKKYWEGVSDYELQEDYVGIRPKIQSIDSDFVDFSVLSKDHHGIDGMLFLQGFESPGLTCALSLAKYLSQRLDS